MKRDTTFVLVSRAPLAMLDAYRVQRGWSAPWVSSFSSDFNYDSGNDVGILRFQCAQPAEGRHCVPKGMQIGRASLRANASGAAIGSRAITEEHDDG